MSANPVARPSSRRSFLIAALAGGAAAAATKGCHVAVAAPVRSDARRAFSFAGSAQTSEAKPLRGQSLPVALG